MDHDQMPDETRHARRRRQQRGIRKRHLRSLFDHHDLDAHVGGNCRVLRMSRNQALAEAGSQDVARLTKLAVVMSETTGPIVTVLHDHRRTRRYRGRS